MRALGGKFRMQIERPYTSEVPLIFATIVHPELTTPITVCTDTIDYLYNSQATNLGQVTFLGFPFDLELICDSDKPPRGRITIQNVDKRVGEALRDIVDSPRLSLEILAASDFNENVRPRTPIGTPFVQYGAYFLRMEKTSVDPMNISADIGSWDLSAEPWPYNRTTQDTLPDLYRR